MKTDLHLITDTKQCFLFKIFRKEQESIEWSRLALKKVMRKRQWRLPPPLRNQHKCKRDIELIAMISN